MVSPERDINTRQESVHSLSEIVRARRTTLYPAFALKDQQRIRNDVDELDVVVNIEG